MRTLSDFNITQKLFVAVNKGGTNFEDVFPLNSVVQLSTCYDTSNEMVEVARNVGGEIVYTNVNADLLCILVETGELVLVEYDECWHGKLKLDLKEVFDD